MVGAIETVWQGLVTPPRGRRVRRWDHRDEGVRLARGAELGRFAMGSTVIVLCAAGRVRWVPGLLPEAVVRLGQAIGNTLPAAAVAGDEGGPPPRTDRAAGRSHVTTETATFAAGCFWGVEEAFRQIPGVLATEVGYTGGSLDRPGYRDVCSGRTGHAEAVRVEFDPGRVTYGELLDVFWRNHDPTQVDRQGPDVGSQYRSEIFVHDAEQERVARASKAAEEASGRHRRPVATRISPAATFWRAEDYHQQYLAKRGQSHCAL